MTARRRENITTHIGITRVNYAKGIPVEEEHMADQNEIDEIEDVEYENVEDEWICPYCGGHKANIGIGCDTPGCQNYEDW